MHGRMTKGLLRYSFMMFVDTMWRRQKNRRLSSAEGPRGHHRRSRLEGQRCRRSSVFSRLGGGHRRNGGRDAPEGIHTPGQGYLCTGATIVPHCGERSWGEISERKQNGIHCQEEDQKEGGDEILSASPSLKAGNKLTHENISSS